MLSFRNLLKTQFMMKEENDNIPNKFQCEGCHYSLQQLALFELNFLTDFQKQICLPLTALLGEVVYVSCQKCQLGCREEIMFLGLTKSLMDGYLYLGKRKWIKKVLFHRSGAQNSSPKETFQMAHEINFNKHH